MFHHRFFFYIDVESDEKSEKVKIDKSKRRCREPRRKIEDIEKDEKRLESDEKTTTSKATIETTMSKAMKNNFRRFRRHFLVAFEVIVFSYISMSFLRVRRHFFHLG